MNLDIKDFPIGTKLNTIYTAPITEYYNEKLPIIYTCCNQFNVSNIPNYNSNGIVFFNDKIDMSEVEVLRMSCEIGYYPTSSTNDIIWNLPSIKELTFANFDYQYNEDINVILNLGDNFEKINEVPIKNWATLLTINSNSKNIKSLNRIEVDKLKSCTFNCDCSKLEQSPYSSMYSNSTNLTYHSGFPNVKQSQNNDYYYVKCPNLTRESYLSIFNNLYDFVGNSETPTYEQGKLKISTNAQSICTEEDFNIPTSKGWVISFG